MQLFRRLYYPVYKKMFLSYVLTVAFTVSIISIVLFSAFSSSAANEISETSIAMLQQTSYASDVIHQEIFPIGNILMNSNDVITSMYADHSDPLHDFQTVKLLGHIASVYPFIKHIGIYNVDLKRYVGTRGISTQMETIVTDRIKSYKRSQYLEYFPRKISSNFFDSTKNNPLNNVITFIFYPEYSLKQNPKGVIIIDLDEVYLHNIIKQLNPKAQLSVEMSVVDPEGTVLSHSNPSIFLKNISKTSYMKKVLESKISSGYFFDTNGIEKILVSYVKSQNLKWVFVSTQPYNALLSNIIRLKNLTLVFSLLIILLSAGISFLLTGKLYSPLENIIQRLNIAKRDVVTKNNHTHLNEFSLIQDELISITERNTSLEENVRHTIPALKELYLRNLLKPSSSNSQYGKRVIDLIESDICGPYFTVLVFKIDNFEDFKQQNKHSDQALCLFAIWNIAHELLSKQYTANLGIMEVDEVAIILQYKDMEMLTELCDYVREIQSIIKFYYKFTFSAGVGCISATKEELHVSYLDAIESVKYRLFLGCNCFVVYNDIKSRHELTYKYPTKLEKKLIDELKLHNREAVTAILDAFQKELSMMTCDHALAYSNQLVIYILRQYDTMLDTLNDEVKALLQIVQKLSCFETLEEIVKSIHKLCTDIITVSEDRYNQKNIDVIETVKQFVCNNFSNPDISIDTAADKVALSSAYLGRIFKNLTGTSFNDYLNLVRIQKARELLLQTNTPSSEICKSVGVYNKTYFFTLFKKMYGITPSQYRKENLSEDTRSEKRLL